MAIPETYISNTGSLTAFLEKIKTAGVPERVSFEFLKTLGFKSSNDRPIITILKSIGFLDSSGKPTEFYKQFRSNDGPKVLAEALRSAYADIFLAHTEAQNLSVEKLKGIIASKSTKGELVVQRIAKTFQSLAKVADFSESPATMDKTPEEPAKGSQFSPEIAAGTPPPFHIKPPSFHYNIEIHLPTTTDITVYNAIFKSLRENLL